MRVDKIKKPNHVNKVIDTQGYIFVHRYAWSHSNMRRVTRRMCKDGLLIKVVENETGFKYVRNNNE